jgi:hypothetical protein
MRQITQLSDRTIQRRERVTVQSVGVGALALQPRELVSATSACSHRHRKASCTPPRRFARPQARASRLQCPALDF